MPAHRATPCSAPLMCGLALLLGLVSVAVRAAEPQAISPVPPTPHASPVASKMVVAGHYRGELGTTQIDLILTEDTDAQDSVHGWYRVLDHKGPSHVLLAGEFEDQALSMEESENGVDVSGTWAGVIDQQGISGQWSDANGDNPKNFTLKRIADKTKGKH